MNAATTMWLCGFGTGFGCAIILVIVAIIIAFKVLEKKAKSHVQMGP